MGTDDGKLRILVAVEVPDPEQISPLLVELQRPLEVCLLGTYVVPEQTAPGQAREQLGDEAEAELQDVADSFRAAGIEVEPEVVFTPDVLETVERTAVERGCHAILLLEPAYRMERILAAVRPGPMAGRIVHLLAELLRGGDYRATLLYVAGEEDDPDRCRRELDQLGRK
ncbi:MAG: universal stress protein, partial [Gemmatimonadota bacterium]